MSTTALRSCEVALETIYGSPVAATGVPGVAGLTFQGLECDRADLVLAGDKPVNAINRAQTRMGEIPAEVDSVWSAGTKVAKRAGTLTLTCPLRGMGTGAVFGSNAAMPLYQLLNTCLAANNAAAATLTPSNAVAVSTTSFETTGTALVGQMFGVVINGKLEIAAITRVNAGAGALGADIITYSPATSVALVSTHTLRQGTTFSAPLPGTVGNSVAIALNGDGWRCVAYGCRATTVAVVLDGRRVSLRLTIQTPFVADDHSGAALVNPLIADGLWGHFGLCDPVYTASVNAVVAPAALARNLLNIGAFELEYGVTLAPKGTSHTAVGATDAEVTSWTAKIAASLATPVSGLNRDLDDGVKRSIAIPVGPGTQGSCYGFYIPAAVQRLDASKYDLAGELVQQKLEWGAGHWAGDYTSTNPAGSNFRMLLAAG